jgi:hypothetical protein
MGQSYENLSAFGMTEVVVEGDSKAWDQKSNKYIHINTKGTLNEFLLYLLD